MEVSVTPGMLPDLPPPPPPPDALVVVLPQAAVMSATTGTASKSFFLIGMKFLQIRTARTDAAARCDGSYFDNRPSSML